MHLIPADSLARARDNAVVLVVDALLALLVFVITQ
jgi:hypothetical protein